MKKIGYSGSEADRPLHAIAVPIKLLREVWPVQEAVEACPPTGFRQDIPLGWNNCEYRFSSQAMIIIINILSLPGETVFTFQASNTCRQVNNKRQEKMENEHVA